MARTSRLTVDAYLAAQPAAARKVLARVRASILAAVPGLEETTSYQMPAYKLGGRVVLYFAGWKQHWSLYPVTAGVAAALKDELAPWDRSKGTVRFPLTGRPPLGLVRRFTQARARETLERAKARAARK